MKNITITRKEFKRHLYRDTWHYPCVIEVATTGALPILKPLLEITFNTPSNHGNHGPSRPTLEALFVVNPGIDRELLAAWATEGRFKEWVSWLNSNPPSDFWAICQLIHDHDWAYAIIGHPCDKQLRVHQMAHII